MRENSYITSLWNNGGPFVGDDGKPHTRVTVQLPWESDPAVRDGDEDHVIHPAWNVGLFRSRGVPIRWFQKEDNSQIELEVPNIKTVTIDRSIDADAAKCDIVMYNQWMFDNGAVTEGSETQGNRQLTGYFTFSRGQSPSAQARWNHEANEWESLLVPNAIIRTYQGYGGHSKTIPEAVADENIMLTGVWLVDDVQINTDGTLSIVCRDTGKLLVDQQLYPPLVPSYMYPLTYYRWVLDNFTVKAAAKRITSSSTINVIAGNKRCVFRDSEVDHWYPQSDPGSQISNGGFLLNGHKGSHSLDGDSDTYYLGVGNSGPDRDFSVMWIEYDCGEYINSVYMHPWAGNYEMYISIYENGTWQGTSTVPYDHSELVGNQPYVVDTGADIRYVKKYGVPWERGQTYYLPRFYKADRVRITFRHLHYSGIGTWKYRGGIREVRLRASTSTTVKTAGVTRIIEPFFFAAASKRDPDDLNSVGYLTVSQMNQHDAFGDCRVYKQMAGNQPTSANVYWVALTTDATGYWVLHADGSLHAHGSALFYGSPKSEGIGATGGADAAGGYWAAVLPTPTNLGYWCVSVDGRIRAYGDAIAVGLPTTIPGFTYDSNSYIAGGGQCLHAPGFLAASTDGTVYALGGATYYGNWTQTSLSATEDTLVCVQPTMAGDGYWLMTGQGRVQAKGAAVDFGEQSSPQAGDWDKSYDQFLPTPSDDGYWMLKVFGPIVGYGDAQNFGSPIPGSTGQVRRDGNYKDYADIIKDLALWSGFLLYQDGLNSIQKPVVFGNIEDTGSYSPEPLPDDMFDKRPVVDAMTQLKEAVGYLLFIDDEGGFRFESPNFWSFGNRIQSTGERVYDVHEIDEAVNLYSYSVSKNDESLRSLIIISSEDPDETGSSTVTTKIVPQTASGLKGLLKPAMWVNGWFQDAEEQSIMAELISLHIWFAQRVGQVECQANPCIQINDQVRIYERQTAETNIHYVRGINSTHDLDSGSYKMTLTTHWLGSGEDWVITDDPDYIEDENHFVVSTPLRTFLENTAQQTDFLLGTKTMVDPSYKGIDPEGTNGSEDPGAGPG